MQVAPETGHFQAYQGEGTPQFVNEAELEYAKILDYHNVPWLYEPHTFEGAGHGFLGSQAGYGGANLKAAEQAWPLTVAFFKKHLN